VPLPRHRIDVPAGAIFAVDDLSPNWLSDWPPALFSEV